jgi:hypothetical protein
MAVGILLAFIRDYGMHTQYLMHGRDGGKRVDH